MMKRILVTGGAGFIGSNLCKRLLEDENNFVICMDNLFTGNMNNIEGLLDNDRFEFIEHNIINPIDIKVDRIYNAACPASPIHYQKDPIFTNKTCVLGTINMLDLATKYNAKMVQFSTSEVYGDPIMHPQREMYNGNVSITGIRACYDEGKRCAETLCYDYHRQYNTRVKVIRIFNTYGPNMDSKDGRVVSNFINQALDGENITLYGDGSQTRSFCYIDDLLEGIIRTMEITGNFVGPINLGNPEEYTVKQVASIIIEMTGTSSDIEYCELPKDDPTKRKPDISLAKKMLKGWQPRITLREGLQKTIYYFQENKLTI